MKKRSVVITLLLLVLVCLAIYFCTKISLLAGPALIGQSELLQDAKEILPFKKNETISYTVKLKGINIGKASLTYKGKTKLDGKDVHLIVFYTNTVNFKDKETMYADIDNFLPIRIERDINNWGKKIRIIEEYDQQNHIIKITRLGKKRDKISEIQQDDKIQNVILLTFLHRKLGNFEIGNSFPITLPLRKIVMRITREAQIRVPHGEYKAYLAESFPKGYKIWFEDSTKAIPVKISGALFLGSASLVMTGYKDNEDQ